METQIERGKESELKPLIYPLVQVSLGAVKYVRKSLFFRCALTISPRLISNTRSYPFHFHIVRSMLHLSRHTKTFIPLSPYIVPILTSSLAFKKPKQSTLRPLDFETNIRAPAQYLKTRVYIEGLVDEGVFILAEWLASTPVQGSIAFPEIIVPLVVTLRKALKSAKSVSKNSLGKEIGAVKGLVERVEESAKWIEQKRKGVGFAPGQMSEVERWESELKVDDAPLVKYVKVQQKVRAKRRNLVNKVLCSPRCECVR